MSCDFAESRPFQLQNCSPCRRLCLGYAGTACIKLTKCCSVVQNFMLPRQHTSLNDSVVHTLVILSSSFRSGYQCPQISHRGINALCHMLCRPQRCCRAGTCSTPAACGSGCRRRDSATSRVPSAAPPCSPPITAATACRPSEAVRPAAAAAGAGALTAAAPAVLRHCQYVPSCCCLRATQPCSSRRQRDRQMLWAAQRHMSMHRRSSQCTRQAIRDSWWR